MLLQCANLHTEFMFSTDWFAHTHKTDQEKLNLVHDYVLSVLKFDESRVPAE